MGGGGRGIIVTNLNIPIHSGLKGLGEPPGNFEMLRDISLTTGGGGSTC